MAKINPEPTDKYEPQKPTESASDAAPAFNIPLAAWYLIKRRKQRLGVIPYGPS